MLCCICDDNTFHLKHIKDLFTGFAGGDWQCQTFSDPRTLINFLHIEKAALVIMDIDLGDENGINCIKEIHSFQPGVVVIFVSANIEFCSSVYTVDHVYFLPKPIREGVFNDALTKAMEQIKLKENKTVVIKNKNEISQIPFEEIVYIESDRRKLIFHTMQGDVDTYNTLDALFEDLDSRFVRCHKSFVVNMDFVRKHMPNGFLLKNKKVIPISQLKQSHSKKVFLDYIGETL